MPKNHKYHKIFNKINVKKVIAACQTPSQSLMYVINKSSRKRKHKKEIVIV